MVADQIAEFKKNGVFSDRLPQYQADQSERLEVSGIDYTHIHREISFIGNFSKMIVRKNGQCGVYACTLVDDVKGYSLGPTL